MAFMDLVAYLEIKIWIKFKLPKISLQPKIGLVKIENPKDPIATKMSLKGEIQNSAQTAKKNWIYMQPLNIMLFAQPFFD